MESRPHLNSKQIHFAGLCEKPGSVSYRQLQAPPQRRVWLQREQEARRRPSRPPCSACSCLRGFPPRWFYLLLLGLQHPGLRVLAVQLQRVVPLLHQEVALFHVPAAKRRENLRRETRPPFRKGPSSLAEHGVVVVTNQRAPSPEANTSARGRTAGRRPPPSPLVAGEELTDLLVLLLDPAVLVEHLLFQPLVLLPHPSRGSTKEHR